MVLRAGVEVEAIAHDGWLALPEDLTGVEVVSVAIAALPMQQGLADPATVRAFVDGGALSVADVVEMLVNVSSRAMERMGRYAPTRLARPLEFLARMGVPDTAVDDAALAELVDACLRTGTAVEVSERYRVPSPDLAARFAAAGVRLLPASDAHQARELGRWRYLEQVSGEMAAASR